MRKPILSASKKLHILTICCVLLLLLVRSVHAGKAENWLSEGHEHFETESYEDALSCFNRAIQLDPQNSRAWNSKGAVLDRLGRLKEALDSYDRALEIDPKFVLAYRNRAGALRVLGRLQDATVSLQRADRIEREWRREQQQAFASGNYQQALVYCELLLRSVSDAWIWNERGRCMAMLCNYDDAIVSYDRSLEFEDDYVVWCNKAGCLLALQRYEEAIVCYEKVLKLNPRHEKGWQGKAEVLAAVGRHEEALIARERARAIQRRAEFTNKLYQWSGRAAIITILFGLGCILTSFLIGVRWIKRVGVATLLVTCMSSLLWLNLRWNWVPLMLALGIAGFILAGFVVVFLLESRWSEVWSLWLQHFPIRQKLKWAYSPARIDAALQLQGSLIRADIIVLVRALQDPEVRKTAASVLKGIGPLALRTLQKALTSEKNKDVKSILMHIIEEIKNEEDKRRG